MANRTGAGVPGSTGLAEPGISWLREATGKILYGR